MDIAFPATLMVKELQKDNPEYDGDKILDHAALYFGGDVFRDRIDRFLVKRKIEELSGDASGIGGQAHYEQRKKSAYYVNRAGGMVDWLTAAVFRVKPEIVITDGTDEQKAYWESLNCDADGLGNPLVAVARESLRDTMLHKRAYFQAEFRETESSRGVVDGKAATIRLISAASADDWFLSDAGKLSMLRRHTVEATRDEFAIWSQPDLETHYWTFFDENSIAVYVAKKKPEEEFKDTDVANLVNDTKHEFGCLPVFDVRATAGHWVMERISDVVKKLFNRESSLTYALDQGAYSLLVLSLVSTDPKSIFATAQAALKLKADEGESAAFIAPPSAIYDPLFKEVEIDVNALYEVLQALAINSANIDQAGRMSGTAIDKHKDPLHTLLASFSWPIRDALNRWIQAVKEYRGESDLNIELRGMDEFDATLDEAQTIINTKGIEDGDKEQTEGQGREADNA